MLRTALARACITSSQVSYLEAHGTGTALGDPIEWNALREVFLDDNQAPAPLVIGAVKSNIGHLEGAAGIAGLIKAVLCLRHQEVPANLHLTSLNPLIDVPTPRPCVFPAATISLPRDGTPLFAGISSFGSGGTNAHVILQRYDGNPSPIKHERSGNASEYGGRHADRYHPILMPWRGLKRTSPGSTYGTVECPQRPFTEEISTTKGPVEEVITAVIQSVLRETKPNGTAPSPLIDIRLDSPLDSLGIDSLVMLDIRNRLAGTFGIAVHLLPSTLLFSHPTVARIAELISSMEAVGSDDHAPNAVSEILEPRDDLPAGVERSYDATTMQQAMLFHEQLDPSARAFVESFTWEVTGVLDVEAFACAWSAIARSHPIMRSSFAPDAIPRAQQVVWTSSTLGFDAKPKLSEGAAWFRIAPAASAMDYAHELQRVVRDERAAGIDVTTPPLFRIVLLPLTVARQQLSRHVVILTIHHGLVDGWSMTLLLGQLASEYVRLVAPASGSVEEDSSTKNATYASYEAFAREEMQWLRAAPPDRRREQAAAYWASVLTAWYEPNRFIGLGPLHCDLADDDVVRKTLLLPCATRDAMEQSARAFGVTVASFTHTAWSITLSAFIEAGTHGGVDLVYGCTASGRSSPVPRIQEIVGPVINTFPMRVQMPKTSSGVSSDKAPDVRSLVRAVHAQLMGSLTHENFPLAEILKLLNFPVREPMFSVIFDYQQFAWDCTLIAPSLRLEQARLIDRIGCPLSMRVIDNAQGMQLQATSESSAVGKAYLSQMLDSFSSVLRAMAETPEVTVSELQRLARCSPQPSVDFPARSFPILPRLGADPPLSGITSETTYEGHVESGQWSRASQLLANSEGWFDLSDVCLALLGLAISRWCSSTNFLVGILARPHALHLLPVTLGEFGTSSLNSFARAIFESRIASRPARPDLPDEASLIVCTTDLFGSELDSLQSKFSELAKPAAITVCMSLGSRLDFRMTRHDPRIPNEVVEGLRNTFASLLESMCAADQEAWSEPVVSWLPSLESVAPVTPPSALDGLLLHEPFITRVRADGAAQALVSYPSGIDGPPKRLRYDALAACAKGLARRLASVLPERLSSGSVTEPLVVAVIMEKGWEQVVAVLATHLVQAAYLPIEARLWPEERVRQVLTHSGAMAVLTQSWVRMDRVWRWLDDLGVPILEVNAIEGNGASDPPEYVLGPSVVDWRAEPDALAYLIYTSGSTGVPKGVCAHHQGARNTIADLASRYALGPGDRILALSSLSFDLSVFDIFGLLAAGGTIVLPPAETVHPPEPAVWLDLLHSQQVSVWNSVPAFLELLVTYLEATREQLPMSLRLIFLSGDWIPLDLPRRLRALSPRSSLQIVSLGGATEASIWSNQYEISQDGAVPTGWASIPYGQPLRNQELLVLDSQLAPCPPWVTGILYIGGAGVAHGYYRDPVRTATHFVVHPLTGALLFRTGDLARVRRGFHPGGLVEILGREDAQVKVHGFRIELGEIERVLSANPRVASAALAVHDQTLCAYVVLRNDPDPIDEADLAAMLQDQCRQSLPSYMVPRHVTRLPRLPISANGKLQRDLLPRPTQRIQPLTSRLHPESEMESLLVDVWGSVLHRAPSELSMDDNFFSIGGDSLRSLQLVARSRLRGLQISVPLIFEHPTIRALAASATWCASARPAVRGTDTIAPGTKPIFPVKFQPETAGESYPLVGVNAAHFVGLFSSSFSRSGIAPQIYFEWIMDVDSEELTPDAPGAVDVECLEHALNSFIRRHATFQSVLRPDGRMQVADQATNYRITNVVRFEGCTSRMEQHATQTRDEMMGGSLDVYTWPLFDIRITELSPRSSVIHIAISLFLMDAMSDLIFRHEISALYRAGIKADVEDVLSPAPRLSFMDYCLAQEEGLTRSEEYGGARAFWMSRLSTLSPGPRLPLLSSANFSPAPLEGEQPTLPVDGRFRNELRWLTADEWARARANCTSRGVTIPSVLIAVYSLTIAQWNSSNRFLLSILHMLRHQVHEDVNKMVGNCSSTLLCDIDMGSPIDEPLTFLAAVLRVARELSQNLAHSTMSGIEVMQELNRQKGSAFQTVAPFIFTTPIGVEQENRHVRARDWIFHERFFSEKVPHAACVNAVKEDPDGTACASLDIIEGIFPEEVMVGLNKTYSTLLDVMCTADPGEWERPVSKWLSALAPPTLREETVTDAPAYSPQQVDAVLMAQPNNKTTDGAVSPRTSFEASVRALFASTLGLEASAVCCVKHSFFDLGGNSLLAVRLSIALSALSERRLSVPSLFAAPTVEGIVAALTSTAGKVGTVSTNRCGM